MRQPDHRPPQERDAIRPHLVQIKRGDRGDWMDHQGRGTAQRAHRTIAHGAQRIRILRAVVFSGWLMRGGVTVIVPDAQRSREKRDSAKQRSPHPEWTSSAHE